MNRSLTFTLVVASFMLLAGCIDDSASLQTDGRERALSLIRNQPVFWQPTLELYLVITRLPECQRRHLLESPDGRDSKIQIFETESGTYLLNEGKNWYQADTDACTLETKQPVAPTEQGKLLGTFEEDENGKLAFTATLPAKPQ
jgi:hypothetical protein